MRSAKLAAAAIAVAALLPGVPKAIAGEGFDLVVLGALGGIQDGNLSASLIHPHGDNRGVTCDAGTLVNGLRVAEEKGAFAAVTVPADSPQSRVGYMLTSAIKGYLISHAHLDHVAGLIVASPDDSKKPIYALPLPRLPWLRSFPSSRRLAPPTVSTWSCWARSAASRTATSAPR